MKVRRTRKLYVNFIFKEIVQFNIIVIFVMKFRPQENKFDSFGSQNIYSELWL